MSDDEFELPMRDHHYTMAHRVLPRLLFQDPMALVDRLRDDSGAGALRAVWNAVGEELAPVQRVPADGLSHEIRVATDQMVIIFTLPPPCATTEAYFVAGVFRYEKGVAGPDLDVRVFTLEYTDPREGASPKVLRSLKGQQYPSAVLCEWTRAGSHLNTGCHVEPTTEAFCAAVQELVGPPRAAS